MKTVSTSVINMGVVCVGIVCLSMHLKEGLAWTTFKQFQVIRINTTKELKDKVYNNNLRMCYYVVFSNVFEIPYVHHKSFQVEKNFVVFTDWLVTANVFPWNSLCNNKPWPCKTIPSNRKCFPANYSLVLQPQSVSTSNDLQCMVYHCKAI